MKLQALAAAAACVVVLLNCSSVFLQYILSISWGSLPEVDSRCALPSMLPTDMHIDGGAICRVRQRAHARSPARRRAARRARVSVISVLPGYCCRSFSGEDGFPVAVDASGEQLKSLVNQRLDSRLLPVVLDFLYGDPTRAAMLPPLIQIATPEDTEGAAKVRGSRVL